MQTAVDFRNVSQELSRQAKEWTELTDFERARPTQSISQAFNPIKFKAPNFTRLYVKEGLMTRLVRALSEARRAESFFLSFFAAVT